MPSAGATSFRSSRAFLVRAADMGESDRRLTFFTETAGIVTAVAKSARRSRKRFGGVLQRYVLLDIAWTESPGRMPVLTSASVATSFWDIVADWERVRNADHLLEIASALFPQPGPKPKVFGAVLLAMGSLASGEDPRVASRKGEASLLSVGGWGPDLSGCRRCKTGQSAPFRFVMSEGGILCARCPGKAGIPLTPGAVKTWRALQSASPAAPVRVRMSAAILAELQNVIPKYVEWCLGRPFRSLGGEAGGPKA